MVSIFCFEKKPRGFNKHEIRSTRRKGIVISTNCGDVLMDGIFPPLTSRTGLSFLKRETTLDDAFVLQKKIGKGGNSEVWQARHRHKSKEEPVAIKLIPKATCSNSAVANEVAVMKVVQNCIFVTQIIVCFQTPTHYAIVMKHATRGTLNERVRMVRYFSELVARFYAAEIAEALFVLHHKGIIHRDLNLDNVLICENGHVAVSDFGLSLLRDTEEMDSDCEPWLEGAGQPAFPAPELLLGLEYDKTVDWWAYGVILYRMVCGEYPFAKPKQRDRGSSACDPQIIYSTETYPTFLSLAAKEFIAGLLCRWRTRRLGRGIMEESDVTGVYFFYNVDWCQLRDFTLPAPFSDLINSAHVRKRTTTHLPVSFVGHMGPTGTATDPDHPPTFRGVSFQRRSLLHPMKRPATERRDSASSKSSFLDRTKEWLDRRLSLA